MCASIQQVEMDLMMDTSRIEYHQPLISHEPLPTSTTNYQFQIIKEIIIIISHIHLRKTAHVDNIWKAQGHPTQT